MALPAIPKEIPEIHFTDARNLVANGLGDERERGRAGPLAGRASAGWASGRSGSTARTLLYVTGYPMSKRPFYTHPDLERPGSSRGFDLLFRGLELVTGGQRLHRVEDYRAALAERGMDPEPFGWYLDAFAHGMPPHGGFAIGLERLVARLTGVGQPAGGDPLSARHQLA